MIREEGYIVYTLPDSPVEITKDIVYIANMGKDLEIYTNTLSTINPPSIFYYASSAGKWYVPAESYEETEDWEEFKGQVLAFEYKTRLVREYKE